MRSTRKLWLRADARSSIPDGPASEAESIFVRINGLRSGKGLECHYTIAPSELKEMTEIAIHPK